MVAQLLFLLKQIVVKDFSSVSSSGSPVKPTRFITLHLYNSTLLTFMIRNIPIFITTTVINKCLNGIFSSSDEVKCQKSIFI